MNYRKPFLFDCFSPDCGTALIVAVAEAMAEGLSDDQMNVLGSFLTAVADMILYKAAQIERNQIICPKPPGSKEDSEEDEFLTDETKNAEASTAEEENKQEENPSKIETYSEGC
jgi:hypothetical protein